MFLKTSSAPLAHPPQFGESPPMSFPRNFDPKSPDTKLRFKVLNQSILDGNMIVYFINVFSIMCNIHSQERKLVEAQFEFISRQLLTLLAGRSRVCMQIQPKQYSSNKLHMVGHLPQC